MAISRLDNLYRQVILDHSTKPHHRGTLTESTQTIEMNNPTCGDVIQLEVSLKDGVIADIAFSGDGCSISTASASMMTDAIIGKTVAEAVALGATFSELVQGKAVENEEALGDAAMLQGVSKYPARIKCATLAWKALAQAIDESGDGHGLAHQFHKE
ncbi:nitrogen fixation NifU-like protein [Enterococcus sp. PF1-24]|uniref:Fe-S cluster assembly sulfur transfer protein SufU n=1 Tax=unclassified Enterococcus TaxID=2608891 RepID=UPI002474A8FB|nr:MULTISPECIES: SUF system NifU family Fe-S cluster assembly protein [unclassified Enterococcus]MDH6365368.1 nitrogen fixation NifU-like protein [Enterococcus sp. PFB1-1]MDH6402469.1 nitrogen fixation NifU-like protein [Enterococcus sp. PF1-24]